MLLNRKLTIQGMASGKTWEITIENNVDLETSVWAFLEEKGMRLASSCLGMGICKRCEINKASLACQTSIQEIVDQGGIICVGYW